jgi:flagellar hook assembly protein FlgD
MLKKLMSAICLWAMLGSFVTLPAFAATVNEPGLIQSFNLTVSGSTPQTFNPSAGQTLQSALTYDATKTATSNGYVKVIQGSTTIKTLATWTTPTPLAAPIAWDGKSVDTGVTLCGTAGAACPNGDYQIEAEIDYVSGADTFQAKQIKNFTIVTAPASVTINSFDIVPTPAIAGGTFDPAKSGGDQDLNFNYVFSQTADSVFIEVMNSKNTVIKTLSASSQISGTLTWDGLYSNKLAMPGDYTAKITVSKSGTTAATSTKTFTVAYLNSGKGTISGLVVSPSTFSSNDGDVVIKFTNTVNTNITVEILKTDDSVVRTFSGYQDDNYGSNTLNNIAWDGRDSNGSSVATGSYRLVVTLRNDYGVVTSEQNVSVGSSTAASVSTDNVQIGGISFSPSSTFDPAKNDQLKIEFDVKLKLDSLKIFAMRGAEKIELQSESNIEKETNVQVEWDGTNGDGDYVDAGSWKIQFESKVGSQNLIAAKTINVTYTKPKVTDLYLSKTKFDNEQNEFTYIFFRADSAADVTIQILMDNSEQENIVEDMAVEEDKWYAVSWDGSGYSYSDNLDIKLLAQNSVNHNVFNSKNVGVDLAEDKVSSSKSNITQDYITPVATDGNDEMELFYNLSETADTKITIHRGNTSTGTIVTTLLNVQDQSSGDHVVTWNGKDDNENTLSKGLYTYKIISNTSTSDTETGLFTVGVVGDVEGGGSSSGSSSSNNGGNVGPGVIVDGGNEVTIPPDEVVVIPSKYCAGFFDVASNNQHCAAIQWAKDQGIFMGYANGTFGVNKAISRVELLKVIMESLGIGTRKPEGNLGFVDVDPSQWYMEYLQAAKNLGIANGDGGKNTIRPNDPSQRVEALKMIFEAMKSVGAIGQINGQCTNGFVDVLPDSWYGKYVCEADSLGLYDTVGKQFGTDVLSTRGEIAEVLYRLNLQNLF